MPFDEENKIKSPKKYVAGLKELKVGIDPKYFL